MASPAEKLRSLENARTVDQDVMRTITMNDLLDAVEELIDVTKSTISEGVLHPSGPFTIGSAITTLEYPGVVTMPWKGFNLFNDGPSPVLYLAVNYEYIEAEVPIKVGQPFHYDSGRQQGVKKVKLTTKGPISGIVNGNTSVRVFGFR